MPCPFVQGDCNVKMRIKMARWWVRLGGKTGSHVTLAEVYSKVFIRPYIPCINYIGRLIESQSKKTEKTEKTCKICNLFAFSSLNRRFYTDFLLSGQPVKNENRTVNNNP